MSAENLVLRAGSIDNLARYVAIQLNNLYPAAALADDVDQLVIAMPNTLRRMGVILAAVRAFEPGAFDHFNSLQYTIFLHLLSNELWLRGKLFGEISRRMFCLNRALNSIELFCSIRMPEVFFVSHGLGSVLGNVTYGERLVVFQNVTVGRLGEDRPEIGENVVLYPGSSVTGRSSIGNNSVLAAGARVHNRTVPSNTIAHMSGGELSFRPRQKDYVDLYLRPRV